ncbi:hypothetical protein [Bythopirellula polymerisocia]|uniref:Autotransporter-associated beta strand repeat protein n=1 Tax=Bythopirellula polymerisocia TaxID=2528003 RepID=A0A5C6D1G9_9BACT|nr:hypothetical protein [Bythopirellula polymerisocia]TWU29674.1 hypothetical protein Pla144_04530 [Bythopirellula polymerisocia]
MRCYLVDLARATLVGSLLIGCTSESHSQIWTGLGDGETWLDGSNWDAGIAPQVPGNSAIFDTNFGIPQVPIQIDGAVAISSLDLINAPGAVVIADDEPLHPFLAFTLDNAGSVVPIKLGATPGYSLTFAESLSSLQFNDDVEVDHQGTSADIFRIESNVFGMKSLTLLPGTGRAELVGTSSQLNNLVTSVETQLGDFNADGLLDYIFIGGDFRIGATGKVSTRAFTQSVGNLDVQGTLLVEPRALMTQDTHLIGGGTIDVLDLATLRVSGGANLFTGKVNLLGGTLSVGSPIGPGGQVTLQQFATIGTTQPVYNPATDPAVVVDPGVTTPGSVGLAIDNLPAYALPIDLNFNNGSANAYRLGSPSLSSIAFGTPIVPFDDGVSQPAYFLGGAGHLFIDATLTDSPISGNSTAVIMPFFPSEDFGVNRGIIGINSFTSFSGPVLVEQEQLVLAHPLAVANAAGLDIVAQGPQYDGGNYQHGTITLDPLLIGSYAGPLPQLLGGALGFTSPHTLASLPTNTSLLGLALFDASGFGGGSPTSNLLALGGDSQIGQDPLFVINDGLDPGLNSVVLVITDQAHVKLTVPNFHSGGTAIVGHSILEIDDPAQLGPGPLNIADGADLLVTNSMTIFNELDMHDAVAFGSSQIRVPVGVTLRFDGNMSTAAAPQATFTKNGAGRLIFDPALPWQPFNQENSWGLRVSGGGEAILHQLPEYDPLFGAWQTGPLILDGPGTSLVVSNNVLPNAFTIANAGFRVLHAVPNSFTNIEVALGVDLVVAGVNDRHQVFGSIDKRGPGTLWFGGDSSGGDAVGSRYDGRGDLNIFEGAVRFGNVLGTDNGARAFPNDMVLHLQNQATLIKEQDQPGQLQSLYINDFAGGGIAEMIMFDIAAGFGDGSINLNLDSLGTFSIVGDLRKLGNAPLRFSAQPGATINIGPGARLLIDDGTVEVDGSGIDPFTDTLGGNSLTVTSNSTTGGLRITDGNVRIQQLSGSGRTRVEAGAKLEVVSILAAQEHFEINGEIQATIVQAFDLLTGRGVVSGSVLLNGGALAPNDDVNPGMPTPATLKITGNLTMGVGDEVNIDFDGATFTNDFVDIGGMASLGGALTLDVHSPFNMLGTSSHVILNAGGGIPSLFNITPNPGDYLGAGVEFAGINYSANDVTIELLQTAYADFNDDLVVNAADLLIWKSNFGLQGVGIHAQGDADLDGDVDGRDFLIWQRQVGTVFTLNPSITPINVPEPSVMGLLAISLLSLMVTRKTKSFDALQSI